VRYNRVVRGLALVTAGFSVALAAPAPAAARTATSVAGPGEGVLLVARGAARGQPLPAGDTKVAAFIAGFAAQVKVRQTFNNPFDRPLEAVYIFPLPHEAAVSDIEVRIGDRTIKSEIKSRAEAAEIFARARREGHTAATLEQERPNVFTQSVTSIPPGEVVTVDIVYDLALDYQDGSFQFVYPMVVGPRHVPGVPTGKSPSGHGTASDTDQVPDGSRITPPTLPAGQRSGRTIRLEVSLDPGKRIRSIDSPTHAIAVDRDPESTLVAVKLVGKDRIPNRDFVLRYRLADASPVATVLAHRPDDGPGTFALLVEPPRAARARVSPRELVFLIDTSDSMSGEPLERAKRAVRRALADLSPRDSFRILGLTGDGVDRALASTAANRRRALAALDRLQAAGETDLLAGLRTALAPPLARGRARVVCLLSDGLVGNEKAVLAEVERTRGSETRIFTLGVGSSVNRYLLDRLAEIGQGAAEVLLPGDDVDQEVTTFVRRLRAPVLGQLAIDWGDLPVTDVWPRAIGDLVAGQPLMVVGRFRHPAKGRVTVRGRLPGGRAVTFNVPAVLDAETGDHRALPRLWARAAVSGLEHDQLGSDDPALAARITDLGLTYRIATAYTSFVAVDEQRTREGKRLRTYVVPVDLPAGVIHSEEGRVRRKVEAENHELPDASGEESEEDDDRDEAPADRSAAAPSAGDAGAEMVSLDEVRGESGSARWRFAVGLGAGDLDRGDSGDLVVGSVHLRADRAIAAHLSLGARLGLLLRPDRVPLVGILFEVAGRDFWHGALRVMGGAGPVLLDGDSAALGLGAGLGLGRRVPVEIRYQHALRSGDDAGALTLGVELAF